ncbi:MAG: NAD-dependent epimerase/dehydratase family protein, partial [Spirochaetes bacterium]|nr:NAD-dependent epimerase/dehydratase family protein [Spirochaetota bacterium]
LIRKFHEAKINNNKTIKIWGTGSPMREFLHVCDLADACVFLMNNYNKSKIINIGTGKDISIKQLAEIIKNTVNYSGTIKWDTNKPEGTPRKLLNVKKLHNIGWKHKISLKKGIKNTYEWYKKNYKT